MYQIELSSNKTGKCVKKELTEPFHRIEIPKNATFLGEGTIGSNALPGLGVNVAVFGGDVGDGKTVHYLSLILMAQKKHFYKGRLHDSKVPSKK